ncbi:hypothetical protein VPHD51_0142 [Vibrio phage D51]
MQYCTNCDTLVDEDQEVCSECGSDDFSEALQRVHCECWVDTEDMDRNQLCGGQGNDCQEDPDILEAVEASTIGFILDASQKLLGKD